ncbi:MAG: dihydrolipoyl dehydrogenase family protein [Actinomycetota bacterium]
MEHDFDLIVVGLGVGGEELAGRCAEAGLNVLAIERKLVGGECPYWGCIPSKMMVRSANALAETKRLPQLAGTAQVERDYAPVVARINEATGGWDDTVAVERLEKKGATFRRGGARFVAPDALEVEGERYRARRGIVIATGGAPSVPPIDGLEDVDFWTNREAIEATAPPASMIVLGAGAIGLEIAQAWRRFGTEVTIVEISDQVLPGEEPENAGAMADVLKQDGMRLRLGAEAERVKGTNAGVAVELGDGGIVEAERLLVATGRRLTLGRLGVEAAGLDPEARAIDVDEHLRAGEGLWAIGDVTGKGAFTHNAMYQAHIAVADILERPHEPADYRAVPRVTFTDPEVGGVGLTESAAREAGIDVRTGVATTSSSARGWIHGPGAEHGVAKLVADAERGILVGASVMGPSAGDVIGLLVLAIKESVPVDALRELIYPYPTFVRGLEDALRELA